MQSFDTITRRSERNRSKRPSRRWLATASVVGLLAAVWYSAAPQVQAFIAKGSGAASSHAGHNFLQPAADTNGLAAWYPFDGNANDYSGHGNNGATTLSGTNDGYVSGKFGKALQLNGSADIDIVTANSAVNNLSQFTYAGWVDPVSVSSAPRLFDKSVRNANIQSNSVDFAQTFSTTNGEWKTVTGTVPNNAWTFVAISYDDTSVSNVPTIYLNGVSASLTTVSTPVGTASADASYALDLGNSGALTRGVYGSMDDVRFYNRILSLTEVQQLYAGSQPVNCDQTCVGWWKLDEKSGSSAADSSGAGNGATYVNSPTPSTGIFGGAYTLNGSNQYVSVPDAPSLDFGTGDFSVAGWFRITAAPSTYAALVSKTNQYQVGSSTRTGFAIDVNSSGDITFEATVSGSGSTGYTATGYADSAWHYVVGTRTGGSDKLYIDGTAVRSTTGNPTASVNNTSGLVMGGVYTGSSSAYLPLTGSIDDVRVYNRLLQPYEIYEQYAAGRS